MVDTVRTITDEDLVIELEIPDGAGEGAIRIVGRRALLGRARTSSEGSVSADEIQARPLLRTGELAEFVQA